MTTINPIAQSNLTKLKIPMAWQGVFWKIFSCACFAGINAVVRLLSGDAPIKLGSGPLPTYTIMLFPNLIGVLLLLPLAIKLNRDNNLFTTRYPKLHLLRVITAAIGIGLWYLGLRYIPIAQAVALSFSGPIITIVGCKLLLNENFNWQRIVAVSLSLAGGFLISRPDQGLMASGFGLAVLLPIAAATIFAGDKIITRKLMANNESPFVLTFYLLLATAIFCFITNVYYGFVNITAEHLIWLTVLGVLGISAHFSFSRSYKLAEVTFLMPFGLSKLVLCSLAGYFAFGELPRTLTMWLGITVIFLSSLILNIKSSKPKSQIATDTINNLNPGTPANPSL